MGFSPDCPTGPVTGHRSVADLRGMIADHQCITKKGLRCIDTIKAANTYAPEFTSDFSTTALIYLRRLRCIRFPHRTMAMA